MLAVGLLPAWLNAAPAIQFGPVTRYTNSNSVADLCTVDFNGDKHLDLVTIDSQQVSLWTNNGAGGFDVSANYLAAGTPRAVVAGDLNNDGQLDLLTANYPGDFLSAFLGNGNGIFSRVDTSVLVNTSGPGLAVGDFNGDGKPDVALRSYGINILLGNGYGTFTMFTNYPGGNAYAVAAADFNNDHKLDLVNADYSSSSMSIYLGNGDGSFAAPTRYSGDSSEYHRGLAIADFNHDSHPDLATVNYYNGSTSVRLNQGDGTFGPETRYKTCAGSGFVAVGDFNHDGNPDLVVTGTALVILPGNANGSFGAALTNLTSLNGRLTVGDFDGDGLIDLAATRASNNAIGVQLNLTTAVLQIARLADQIQLNWPNWTGYRLEGSTNLFDPSSWVTVNDAPGLIGNRRFLTPSITSSAWYYRLHKPLP